MSRPPRIGVTGGIAAGKSTVAEMLRARGAAVIDTDRLAHEAMAPGGPAYPGVIAAFGAGIAGPDGAIDRQRLGEIVFRDRVALERLNAAVHPHVLRAWREAACRLEAADPAPAAVVVVVPLLYEAGLDTELEPVVAVICTEATALRRLRDRGLSETDARLRMAAQLPMDEKARRADYVIANDFDRSILARQVERLWRRLPVRDDRRTVAAVPEE